MEYLSIDFETRSTVDLRRTGVYPYAEDDTTSIICMAYAFGDGPVEVWKAGETFPSEVLDWAAARMPMRAHNAQFERIMWNVSLRRQVDDFVPTTRNQWYCTAAEAAAMSLPRHLKQVAKVLNVEEQKDEGGRQLMLQMCKPRSVDEDGTVRWWDEEDPDKLADLIDYCMQDVRAERAVASRLRRLDEKERQVYLLDQKINDRGIRLDIPLIQAAQEIINEETERANEELAELTDGVVTKATQVQRITEWVQEQGAEVDNLRKATLRDLLEEQENPDLPGVTEDVLRLRYETAKTSNRKVDAMLRCRCSDDRARGLLLYHGAGTGRWSGKLIQPQNFPRPTIKRVEGYIPEVMAYNGDTGAWDDQPLEVISSMLRSMLIASEDHRLMAGDFSQIEARMLGWIAGEPYGEKEYEKMGAAIYGLPLEEVTKDSRERQIGKNAVLGAGYQMGSDRFQDQVWEQTGIELSDEMAEHAINTYRERKASIVRFWYDIEGAAMMAVREPGRVTYAGVGGTVQYVVRGQFLWCVLPSGRPLAYALPRVEKQQTPWGAWKDTLTYMGVNSYTRKWERLSSYGGHLTENVVQAMARDVLARAMLWLEEMGYPVVLTVHDEVVCDVPEGHGSEEEFRYIMEQVPTWAEGCPIEAETWEGERYRK